MINFDLLLILKLFSWIWITLAIVGLGKGFFKFIKFKPYITFNHNGEEEVTKNIEK